ncbi:hypothetical protein BMS_1049 [Halobacteriovorax marinus SJ]|uniref:Uncharacterized protein n=1 Tax=Halobacteriovorax marinus (strain ATCC BAA-682 / DSM 15412 / SJ) TaxID=862908 RepID=E1WXX6_HALMS|nr:hypothetical protein [Halobacteriovorax marinus]CBW25933.1 hypothetical protein BMS_1049 [Halobacteriovorax marinus SJ]
MLLIKNRKIIKRLKVKRELKTESVSTGYTLVMIRVSSQKQGDRGTSLEEQEKAIRE